MRGECILRPTISGVVNDLQIIKLLELLKTKTTESPYSLAKCLCTIKAVFSKPYFPTTVFGKRKTVSFDFSGMSYIVEFTACAEAHSQDIRCMDVDNPHRDDQMVRFVTILKDKVRESPITMATLLACIKSVLESSGIKERLFPNRIRFNHGDDTPFREYVVEFNSSCDRTFSEHETNGNMVGIVSMTGAMDHYRGNLSNIKRKRGSDVHEEEDNFVHHNMPMKRRAADKHKAPPLSCEAVKRLFSSISKQTLLQRLEESKALISSITESYFNIRQSSNAKSPTSSSRLNLLCHLLQSPPTSRIDGISSKVFSNLELYKLFTTYNAYKEDLAKLAQTEAPSPAKKVQEFTQTSTEASVKFPTYSSFIDPTVTLHIKEQTGGREVGKHRLNCAWRLSILCELLGKGVLLMTKELSGAKLERILVEEFSKLTDFLKNPDNHDWVAQVKEKLDLPGFDDVYAPLAEADIVYAPIESVDISDTTTAVNDKEDVRNNTIMDTSESVSSVSPVPQRQQQLPLALEPDEERTEIPDVIKTEPLANVNAASVTSVNISTSNATPLTWVKQNNIAGTY
ncbi:6005_t:CDS:2 [Paraglomus brasilianum]|uniref:6005_t:CDS:1 n=1 Tax=Paraglomus brasilianum TaxID=144538 RepID=A0A9N8Z0K9_9GLOM|nr:6005_t:CDS:2 [Paraglomus brasilianum]